ncbi:helix-turn-helix domain-containing protein [Streptosporangium subroseum]|uniref:helix-turn-helix domain-containing protein n=1 Tax=Streptosporangium subroseum TaxID=106412 RepID=UPI003092D6FE|nr:helix-turn-helix transcriptional regulator [Streptosporangium subroseum]
MAIAERLREIMRDAGLNGRSLAEAASWHESKSSRLLHAKTLPSDEDLRVWCQVCGALDQVDDLVSLSRTAESMYVEWKRLHRTGLKQLQDSKVPLYESTRLHRVYCSQVVPGFLQTGAYARAMLKMFGTFHNAPDDLEAAVASRMLRNNILRRAGYRFKFLIEEQVLRHQLGDPSVMREQLDHLLEVTKLPSTSIGIIPVTTPRKLWALEAFNIFDDSLVQVELLTATVNVTQPSEIDLYIRGFADMAHMSVVGAPAKGIIQAAKQRFL